MKKYLSKKSFLSIIMIVFAIFCLVGCKESEAKKAWDHYTEAVNNKDLELLKKAFPSSYEGLNESYFDHVTQIKTKSFEEVGKCDFSTILTSQVYYLCNVDCDVTVDGQTKDMNFDIYLYSDNKGLYLCNDMNFTDETKEFGNEPNQYWLEKVYFSRKGYLYKEFTNGDEKSITYIESSLNTKEVVIPEEVDGVKVTTIGEFAFYKYSKVLCFTIPKSKLQKVTLPSGLIEIKEKAFYQCTNLKKLMIPSSVTKIDKLAFASCTSMTDLYLTCTTEETAKDLVDSIPSAKNTLFTINNAHNLQRGEIIRFTISDTSLVVKWSVIENPSVLTIDASTGKATAIGTGKAKVRAEIKGDPSMYCDVTIEVADTAAQIMISADAFNRCNKLKNIYIDATNPNSIGIFNGTGWTFNKTCKIYVPAGSKEMYTSHTLWSSYADQIEEA